MTTQRPTTGSPTTTAQIRALVTQYIESSGNADVLAYGRGYLEQFDRNQWFVEYMMRLGRMRKSRVLDVGCGFGWQALTIALAGDNDVVANDIRASMTDVVDERVAALAPSMTAGRVTSLLGDVCALDLPAESFDAIFCNQTIEHVHDLDRFFATAARLLKPGGRMVLANDNNALCTKQIAEFEAMWRKRDRSQAYIDELRAQRPIENADIEPYAVMRERVARGANPNLSDAEITRLADATAGLLDAEVAALARRHTAGGPLPTPPPFRWSRNPTTGEYCERQLDPFELVDQLARHGLRARVRHAFRKPPLGLLNGVPVRAVNRALFNVRAAFLIVCERV